MNESTDNILKVIERKKQMAANEARFTNEADVISQEEDEELELEREYNRDRQEEVKPHPSVEEIKNVAYTMSSALRNVKYMSEVLKRQSTPKSKKVLTLAIEVHAPRYDEEGNVIHDEEELGSDEEEDEAFEGRFNAHLLEDEVLD